MLCLLEIIPVVDTSLKCTGVIFSTPVSFFNWKLILSRFFPYLSAVQLTK